MYESGSGHDLLSVLMVVLLRRKGDGLGLMLMGRGPWLLVFCCSDEMDRLVREPLQRSFCWL